MYGKRKLEPIQNVGVGQHFVLTSKIVLGSVIERIILDTTGSTTLTIAQLLNLVMKVNGKVVWGPINGSILTLFQQYLLFQTNATFLTLDFTEPAARSIQGQLMGALDTNAAGVQEFTIEGDISGAAVAPKLAAWAELRPPQTVSAAQGFDVRLAPMFRCLLPSTWQPTAALESPYDLNTGAVARGLLKRLWISAAITSAFRVKEDGLDRDDLITPALNNYIATDYGRNPQVNLYVWDLLVDGSQSDAMPLAVATQQGAFRKKVMQWLYTSSGAGTALVWADCYKLLSDI